MKELQIADEQKINRIYELVSTDELTRESFEGDLKEATEKYKGYIATASTLKDDKAKRAELNKLIEAKHRIRIDTKNLLSETPNTWDKYAKSIIAPFEKVVSELDKSIKGIEEHQCTLKLDTVKNYIAKKASEYMLDPRLFDEKAQKYIKASDFMADGFTLKKATMKSLEDMVTFEYQKQQEHEKEKATISGQCAEYGITDQPYIRMLQSMSLADVMQQIMSDYLFEQEKQKIRQAEAEREQLLATQRAKEEEAQNGQHLPQIDPETGEILDGGQLYQNEFDTLRVDENELKRYTQKMTLEVYFTNAAEKDLFKAGLSELGFEHKQNYQVSGYQQIEPVTQEQLNELCGWQS